MNISPDRSQPNERESGIFAAGSHAYTVDDGFGNITEFPEDGLAIPFSNSSGVEIEAINDFEIFNDYIHYYPTEGGSAALIPYLSDYDKADPDDKYDCACGIEPT